MEDKVKEFLDYLEFERKYSDKTVKSYEIDLYHLKEYCSINKLNYLSLTYDDVSKYVISTQKSGYKSTSINRLLSSLRSFYNYLIKKDVTDNNPFDLINNLKTEKRLPNYFKYSDFEEMLNSLDDDKPLTLRNALIIELLLATGLRVSELSNIKINDMDLKNNEIRIMGKGSKERIVYYRESTKNKLYYYLKDGRGALLNGKYSPYLLINNNGGKLTDRGVRYIIEGIIKKCSINVRVTPHTFRHTFATMLLNEGCDIRSVQELLGHANLNTTSIYTHLTNDAIRKVYLNAHPHGKYQIINKKIGIIFGQAGGKMIDDNSKKLGRVFMIVLIVIGIIIMLYLVHHTLSVNNYKYELPTTTTLVVDKDITSLSDTEKINYNTLINDEGFLRGINNAIDYNNKDINVFESEITKFKYLYSNNDKGALTFDEINALSESVFNTELSKENIADYLNQDGAYEYEINYGNPKYCIKVVNEKNGDNLKTVYFDMIDYNSESCKASVLEYSKDIVALKGTLVLIKSDNKYFINSMMIR